MKTRIEVDNWTIIRFWSILFGLVGLALLAYWSRSALVMIAMAGFLAVAVNPLVSKLSEKALRGNRPAATAIVFVSFLVLLITFGLLVAPSMIAQAKSFSETIPNLFTNSVNSLRDNGLVKQFNLTSYLDQAAVFVDSHKQEWITQAGSLMFNGVNSVIGFIFSGVIVLTLTFMMLVEAPSIVKAFWSFYDDKNIMKKHQSIAKKMAGTITGFVSGQLIQVTINGVCAGIAVFVLTLFFAIPTNLILPVGLIVSVLGLIPLVGTTLGGILGAFLIALTNLSAGVIFIIYFVIYQQIENNVISPYIQSKALNLSALTVLVAVTVGIYLFGILGAIISIPLAGCIKILLQEKFVFES